MFVFNIYILIGAIIAFGSVLYGKKSYDTGEDKAGFGKVVDVLGEQTAIILLFITIMLLWLPCLIYGILMKYQK